MTDYEKCKKIANENDMSCWEFFDCDTAVNIGFGILCKGECKKALDKYESEADND